MVDTQPACVNLVMTYAAKYNEIISRVGALFPMLSYVMQFKETGVLAGPDISAPPAISAAVVVALVYGSLLILGNVAVVFCCKPF